jgi:hypothetical protein
MFADQPGFVARQMLLALIPDPRRWSIGVAAADELVRLNEQFVL